MTYYYDLLGLMKLRLLVVKLVCVLLYKCVKCFRLKCLLRYEAYKIELNFVLFSCVAYHFKNFKAKL
jgi:hypothetical protein